MVSSELPELLQVADRILVMRDGAIVTELPRTATQQEIMQHAAVAS
jgi:ABC-type sugar transport system ATPase subunit